MRRRRLLALALSGVSVAALGLASVTQFTPRLIWNASESAPLGLYRTEQGVPKIGDYVLVQPNRDIEILIVERGYLPDNIPLLKRVAALPGAEICRKGEGIFIDGSLIAEALPVDSAGRVLPIWQGCIILSANEVFLLNDPKNSLDGRYFGATDLDDVIGVVVPLWVEESER